jgi:hypothetical protein
MRMGEAVSVDVGLARMAFDANLCMSDQRCLEHKNADDM